MKFLCVPCDSPMKLQSVGPPERGSLSVVYSCPECGYEMAMLTNAYETQVVQSLGVRIGPESDGKAVSTSSTGCPFTGMIPGMGESRPDQAGAPTCGLCARGGGRRADPRPVDSRGGSSAGEYSRVRPPHGADRHREIRPGARGPRSGREDPRRGPRLLRDVSRMPQSEHERHRHEHARDPEHEPVRPALRRLLEPHLPL